MIKNPLNNNIPRTYKNNGQHAQQVAIFTYTGKIEKADNLPHWLGGDLYDIQIKSKKATICYGVDIDEHLKNDAAKRYGYVTKDFNYMYIMSREEYREFVIAFSDVGRDSTDRGGRVKLRFKNEPNGMVEWLESHLT